MTAPTRTPTSDDSDDFFRQLADGAPAMIWMSGLDMGCFYFNRAWLDFRGRNLEQEAGNGWAEGVHPDDLERCVSHYVACFERRLGFAMSYRLRHHTGSYRWILDRGAPHFLPDGTFLGFFGGCAEIENDAQISRHAELGSMLSEMKLFARRIAADTVRTSRALKSAADVPLQIVAKGIYERHQDMENRMKHAVSEMEQLATDMLSYGRIAPGACWPASVPKST